MCVPPPPIFAETPSTRMRRAMTSDKLQLAATSAEWRKRVLADWSGPGPTRAARALTLAGSVALFLQSAATFEVVYTMRLSYVLCLLALVCGAPWVWRGWSLLPWWLGACAVALLATYAMSTALLDQAVLATSGRGGRLRALLYLVDIGLGLGMLGLLRGLWATRTPTDLIGAILCGGILAGLYGLYQWLAQRFGLPLADLINTRDSNGVTTDTPQGAGLLGWERIRATFLEPHYLGAYLASTLPLAVAVPLSREGRRRWVVAGGAVAMVLALGLTASVPAWGILGLALTLTAGLVAMATGRAKSAAVIACAAIVLCLAAPIAVRSEELLSATTGRSVESLAVTTDFRFDTWDRVMELWAEAPAVGYGAGQSAVRITLRVEGPNAVALSSAQGLWAAALLDAGVLGFAVWLLLLGGIVVLSGRAVYRRPTPRGAGVFCAGLAGLLFAGVSLDRLDLRAWILLGLMVVVSSSPVGGEHGEPRAPHGGEG